MCAIAERGAGGATSSPIPVSIASLGLQRVRSWAGNDMACCHALRTPNSIVLVCRKCFPDGCWEGIGVVAATSLNAAVRLPNEPPHVLNVRAALSPHIQLTIQGC